MDQLRKNAFWLVGVVGGLVYAAGLYVLTKGIFPDRGMAVGCFLLGVPLGSCILISVLSDPRGRRGLGHHIAMSCLGVTLILLGAAVVFREGSICLIMAAPLFYGAGVIIGLITGLILKAINGGRGDGPDHPERVFGFAGLVLLPIVLMPLERLADYPTRLASETSVVVIDAPPEAVWRNVVQLRNIQRSEQSLDFSHTVAGIPRPLDARLEGEGAGAVRHIRWTRKVHFKEVVGYWRPAERLGWTFAFDADSIPLAIERNINLNSDYLRLSAGEYRLEAMPGGRTRLTLQTRYWVKTPINAYCTAWGHIFLQDIHMAVLDVIKARSEDEGR